MRRYAHKILAALLCMCLLISYTPLPASAAGAPEPSVSGSGGFEDNGNGFQATSTVNVLTLQTLEVVSKTEDFAAPLGKISSEKYNLEVVAKGQGALTYDWTRTVYKADDLNAPVTDDISFTYGGTDTKDKSYATYDLWNHVDTLKDGYAYVYKIKVTDETEKSVETTITVTVSSNYTDGERTKDNVSVKGSLHYLAVLNVATLASESPAYSALQQAAAGLIVGNAWQIDLTGTSGQAPFMGKVAVSIPVPVGIPEGTDPVIFGMDSEGKITKYTPKVENGKAVFDTTSLGMFAIAWQGTSQNEHTITVETPEHGSISPSGDDNGQIKVADGGSITFTIRADEGYVLKSLTVDSDDVTGQIVGNTYTFTEVKADHTISATFEAVPVEPETKFSVSASVDGGLLGNGKVAIDNGTPGDTVSTEIEKGKPAIIYFTPNDGYVIDEVKVDLGDGKGAQKVQVIGNSYKISAVTADTTVIVKYKEGTPVPVPTYTVNASVTGGGGTVQPDTQSVKQDATATITVAPDQGYVVDTVTANGADAKNKLDDNTITLQHVDKNINVVVTFKLDKQTFTGTATAGEGGTISPAETTVTQGSSATYYIYPDKDMRLKSLTLTPKDGTASDVASKVVGGVYVLDNVQSDYTLTAEFEASGVVVPEDTYYAVTAFVADLQDGGKGGSISPSGVTRVKAGSSQTFTFLPEEGYVVNTVKVDDGAAFAPQGSSYTVGPVTKNTTIEVTYRSLNSGETQPPVDTFDITATAGSGGTISPSGTIKAAKGGSMPFTFIPNSGYELDQVLIDDVNNADAVKAGSYRFDNVQEPHSIQALFKKKAAPVEPDYYNLTVTAGSDGSASPLGTTRVAAGATQTVFFYPNTGFVVGGVTVTDGDGTTTYTENTAEMTKLTLDAMKSDVSVDVTFRTANTDAGEQTPTITKHKLTSVAETGGTISPAGDIEVIDGESVTYTVTPEAGYTLNTVTASEGSGNVKIETKDNKVTVSEVKGAATIKATFKAEATTPVEPTYRTVTATSNEFGTISPSGQVRVATDRSVTFYLIPDSGKVLKSLKVGGEPVEVIGNSYTLPAGKENVTVAAEFGEPESGQEVPPVPTTYNVTSSASTGGTISPSGVTRVVSGGEMLFTFTPDAGWHLSQVMVDKTDVTSQAQGGSYRVLGITEDTTVRATFERDAAPDVPTPVTVTTSVNDETMGSVSPAGESKVAPGSTQTFYFTPETGYKVTQVIVNDTVIPWSGLSYTLANITANTTLEVTFAAVDTEGGEVPPVVPDMHTVSATVPNGNGSVSPATAQVADKGSLLLTFTPSEGYVLKSVKEGETDYTSQVTASGTLRLTNVTTGHELTVEFVPASEQPTNPDAPEYRTISASSGDGGSLSPEGDVRVPMGGEQSFVVRPNDGKKLKSLTLTNGTNSQVVTDEVTNGVYTLTVQEDYTLYAEFTALEEGDSKPSVPDTHKVTATAGPGGTISPSGTFEAADNSTVTFVLTPDAGYELKEVKDGSTVLAVTDGACTLDMGTSDHTVTATFAPKSIVDPQPSYHTVTASVEGGNGSVSPAGATRVKDGGTQTFLFTPDDASQYTLNEVKVNNVPVAVDGFTYTLTDVHKDTTVVASFRALEDNEPNPTPPDTFKITADAGQGGSVSPSGDVAVAKGSTPSFTFIPESGWQLSEVTVDNQPVAVQDNIYTFAPVTGDAKLHAEFERVSAPEPPADPIVTATVKDGVGGTITPSGVHTVPRGSSPVYSIVPDEGYKVTSIAIDGRSSAFSGTSFTLFNVTNDTTIEVAFGKKQEGDVTPDPKFYNITAEATAGGTITPEGIVPVAEGEAMNFTFAAIDGYELYKVVIDEGTADAETLENEKLPVNGYRLTNVQAHHAIKAYFAKQGTTPDPEDPDKPTGTAIITVSHGENGTITAVNPDNTITDGKVEVPLGTNQGFKIAASTDYVIEKVTVNGKDIEVPDSPRSEYVYDFENVTTGGSIYATFAPADQPIVKHYIDASADEGGTITPSGKVEVVHGEDAVFTIEPDSTHEIAGVFIGGDSTNKKGELADDKYYTFTNVEADSSIHVTFQEKTTPVEPHTIMVSAGEGGSIMPSGTDGAVKVEDGADITFSIEPNEGYTIESVTVDNKPALDQLANDEYTFKNVTKDHSISATFKEIDVTQQYDVTAHVKDGNGAVAINGGTAAISATTKVNEGGEATITFAPEDGYIINTVSVDRGQGAELVAVTDNSLKVSNITSNVTVTVTYKEEGTTPPDPDTFTVSATAGEGGSITPASQTVKPGESATFHLYPETGYVLDTLTLDDQDVTSDVNGGVYVLKNISKSCELVATFKTTGIEVPDDVYYTVKGSVKDNKGGTVSPSGTVRVKAGASQTFTFVPEEDYTLDTISVNGGDPVKATSLSYTVDSVMANTTVEGTFRAVSSGGEPLPVPTMWDITATAGSGGSISPSGTVQVAQGGSMPFTFIPQAGYEIDEVTIDGTANPDAKAAGAYRFDNVTSTHTIAVTFKQKQVDPTEPDYYNLTVNAGENGSVSPEGTTKVAAGASQTVFFYPKEGFVVGEVTVTDADGTTTYTENTAEMTKLTLDAMKSDVTVDVSFVESKGEPTPQPKTYELTASVLTKGGSISPADVTKAVEGSSVTYTVTPEAGYHVKNVLVNNKTATLKNNSFTVSNIRMDITITVSFELDASTPVEPTYRTVKATSEGPGTISPAGQMRVAADRSMTFYLIPDEGMVLSSLTVNDSPVEVVDNSYTLSAGTDEASVHAVFDEPEGGVTPPPAPVTYEVTSSATTGGTISPSGVTRVVSGGDVLYTFTADAGWHLSTVTVGGTPVTDDVQNNSYRLLGVTENTTVQATFERDTTTPDDQKRYQVEASVAGAGGTISPAGTFEVAPGATQTFYFTPNDTDDNKYRVKSITLDGETFNWSGLSYTLANISQNTTLAVEFEQVPDDEKPPVKPTMYDVTTSSTGDGTVSPLGTTKVAEHGSLLLTFTPNTGSELTSVKVGNDEKISEVSASGTLRLNNITTALTVSATFETKSTQPDNPEVPEYRTIHVTSSAGGSLSPEGDVRVVKGGSQTFIVTPNKDMKLESLTLDGNPVVGFNAETDSTYTLSDVANDCTLRAEFVERDASVDPEPPTPPVSHVITATANQGGTVSPSGTFDAADNSSVTFTFVPEAGYKLSAVTLDDAPITVTNGTYTLSNISGPHELNATFVLETVTPPAPTYHTVTASVEGGSGSVSPAGEIRVRDGGTQTFLFTPAENSVIDKVTVDGQPVVVDGFTYTLTDVHNDVPVKVTFRAATPDDPKPTPPEPLVISASAGQGGSVSPSGDVTVAAGSTPTFTFVPDAGWELAKVTVGGTEVAVQNNSYTFAPVVAPAKLHAEFQRVSNPEPVLDPVITASVNGGRGKISPAGAVTVARGSSQTFSFIPDAGYKVSQITVGGKAFDFSGYSYTIFDVTADMTIGVTFEADSSVEPPAVHTVSSFASAGGIIEPEGDQSVVHGGALSFRFAPYDGYELYRVVVDKDSEAPYELSQDEMAAGTHRISNVQGNRTIHAYFAQQGTNPDPDVDPDQPTGSVIIAASAGEHGSISPAGDVSVTLGQDATFTIAPERGYELATLTVDGQRVSNPGLSYTFPNVQAPHTINATFKASQVLTITAEASAGGTIDPSGTKVLNRGESQTFTFSPDAECELVRVLVDGAEVPQAVADGFYTFDNVVYNHTIRAEFQKKTTQPVEPEYVVIHASAGPNGIVSPSGDVRVKKGENATTFTFMPNQDYVLDDVTVDGESVLSKLNKSQLTLTNVKAETTIYATFHEQELGEPDQELPTMYEVFASATTGGSISPRGAVQVAENQSVSFLVKPNAGYQVKHMLVGAEEKAFTPEGGTFTLDNVTAAQTVRAVFEHIDATEPEDPNLNVDVQVKVKVQQQVNTHDAGVVTPTFTTVEKGGTSEPFYVYPKPGYGVESITANGDHIEFHEIGKASPEPATFSLFGARASLFAEHDEPGAAGGYWFVVPDVTEDLVIDVAFKKLAEGEATPEPVQTHKITARAGAGGSIMPTDLQVPNGESTTFTVKPDSDYVLQSLTVLQNGKSTDATGRIANNQFKLDNTFDLAADTVVSASFQHKETVVDYVVVHASVNGAGGTVSPLEARVERGGNQTFTFKPASDKYVPDTVTVNGVKDANFDGSYTYEIKNVQVESNLVVTFRETQEPTPAPKFYDVTSSVNDKTMGSVSPSGTMSVEEGQSLAFKFTPKADHRLANVLLDGSPVSPSLWASGSYTLGDIRGPHTVQGVFEKVETPQPDKAIVTGQAGPGGRISPATPQTVNVGESVTFTFYPNSGYEVESVTVDGKTAPNPGTSYTVQTTESKNYYLYVTFKSKGNVNPPTPGPSVNTHYITAKAGENGSISPSGTVEVVDGEDAAFVFKPKDDGYVIDYVEVDGKRVDNPGTSYTFENVKAGHKIYVAFRAKGAEPTPPPDVDPTFHIIKAGVTNNYGGIVSPSGEVRVEHGKGQTFSFLPYQGYMVTALCIDGVWMPFNGSSYYLADVSNGHTLEVRFAPIAAPAPTDPIDGINRGLDQGMNLLKTGDANGPLACTVLGLAVLAAGLAVTARRRSTRGDRR
ncbi:MAG TPA: hypothetical protein H9877_11900 [Candidatus Gordonibacter avicola]|nr:hypothetical protein [Candidatus Gordonibacter avicola]